MGLVTNALIGLGTLAVFVWWKIHVPFYFPNNIPKIPIYVSLLGLYSNMGQDQIYERWFRQPLEKHGVVRYWFAGQWSLLVTKPEYLTDMFRNEHIYTKAGNHKKVPWTVSALLLGDNIISAHGDNWKLYVSIMKPGLTKRVFDSRPLVNSARKMGNLLLEAQSKAPEGKGVVVNPFVLRYAISVMGQSFLDVDFRCLDDPKNRIADLQANIKPAIFTPWILNFPILDQYPALFRSRKHAFAKVREFQSLLFDLIRNRPRLIAGKTQSPASDQVIQLLEKALSEGRITNQQYQDNIKITFIVAHENTQLLLNSMFYQIGVNQEVQDKLRAEVNATGVLNPTAAIVNKLPYLTSVIYELLRLYPPISQLVNRQTKSTAMLGAKIPIPPDAYLGWNAYGVHTSTANWGPRANEFLPERWGSTVEEMQLKFRRETVKGTFISFNAHTRKCLGQGFVLLQTKITVFELVRSIRWQVDPEYKFRLPSGGVLAPVGCKILFEEIQASREVFDEADSAIDQDAAYDAGALE